MNEVAMATMGLVKTFGPGPRAVDQLELAVPAGCVYGLLGANGAGKTTTIKLLLGLLRPDAGTARVLGLDLWRASPLARAQVACVAQDSQGYDWLTVAEIRSHVACFYPTWDEAYACHLARRFGLDRLAGQRIGRLSGGERRKLAMLLALAARPKALLLDEPAASLDPMARRELLDELIDILAADGGPTVLYSSHLISDLERLAEQVGILHHGRLLYGGPLDRLRDSVRRVQVILASPPPADVVIPGALWTERAGSMVQALVRVESEADLRPLYELPGARVDVFRLGLEDILIGLVQAADRDGTGGTGQELSHASGGAMAEFNHPDTTEEAVP